MVKTTCHPRRRFACAHGRYGIVAAWRNSYQQCQLVVVVWTYGWVERLSGHGAYSDRNSVFHDDLIDLGVALEMEIRVNGTSAVDIRVS